MKRIAQDCSIPLQVLLSAYALSLSPSMSLVIGARKVEQVKENALLLDFRISDEIKREVERLWVKPLKEEI